MCCFVVSLSTPHPRAGPPATPRPPPAHSFSPPRPSPRHAMDGRSPSFFRQCSNLAPRPAEESRMAKRSARNAKVVHNHEAKVTSLFDGGWNPLGHGGLGHGGLGQGGAAGEDREQSYRRTVRPQSDNQRALVEAMTTHPLTLALGPAGTGKTYLAVSAAVAAMEANSVGRIVLTRPAVEAGESLGFLPGDLHEKLAPYLRPLYDALNERIGGKRVRQMMAEGAIEIAPVAYMRGRTPNNPFVVIYEAQNCTYGQIKMLLTRLGWHSTMVLTGDPDQSGLLDGLSGLLDIARRLDAIPGISVIRLNDRDIVRHPLVGEIRTVLKTRWRR